jgi:hypothetical protein
MYEFAVNGEAPMTLSARQTAQDATVEVLAWLLLLVLGWGLWWGLS